MEKRTRKRDRGQSLVELALSLPMLVLIISGLVDLGRVYFTFIALEESAAEAALYLSINPQCSTSADSPPSDLTMCDDPNNAEWRAKNISGADRATPFTVRDLDPNRLNLTQLNRASSFGVGDIVSVTVGYTFEFSTPGIQAISKAVTGSDALEVSVTATHIILIE